jgi:hypothetical protein
MADQVEKYDDELYKLDDLIFMVYNAVYVNPNQYQTQYFDLSSLKLWRFKMYDYNLDKIFEETNIKFAGKYPTGLRTNPSDPNTGIDQLCFKRQGETKMTTIRIVPYSSREASGRITDPVNVNQIIRTLLSEIVVDDKTHNILMPIINVDVEGSDLMGYDKVKDFIDKDKIYSVQITEKFYKLVNLNEFLRDYPLNEEIIKSIIYQAIDLLYQINIIYSGFRCNGFFPDLIDCYLKTNHDIRFPELKLGNFYLSEINNLVTNDYVITQLEFISICINY